MKMKKTIAMIMAMTMITGAFAACGEKEEGTPHTTYSVDEINNMSNDELEKALEQAAQEIEASEKAAEETAAAEAQVEEIDIWKDVEVTFMGSEGITTIGLCSETESLVYVKVAYVGDNQFVKDNVIFTWGNSRIDEGSQLSEGGGFVSAHNGTISIEAQCLKQTLDESGVVLSGEGLKNRMVNDEGKYEDYILYKEEYPVTGLTKPLLYVNVTDYDIFMPLVDWATDKIKNGEVDYPDQFEWAIGKDIYPSRYYLSGAFGGVKKEAINEDYVFERFTIEYVDSNGEVVGMIDGDGMISVSDENGNVNTEFMELWHEESGFSTIFSMNPNYYNPLPNDIEKIIR